MVVCENGVTSEIQRLRKTSLLSMLSTLFVVLTQAGTLKDNVGEGHLCLFILQVKQHVEFKGKKTSKKNKHQYHYFTATQYADS